MSAAWISLAMSSPIRGNPEEVRLRRWVERVSEDVRALLAQPEAKPGTLFESGMAGDQDASPAPGIGRRHQVSRALDCRARVAPDDACHAAYPWAARSRRA